MDNIVTIIITGIVGVVAGFAIAKILEKKQHFEPNKDSEKRSSIYYQRR